MLGRVKLERIGMTYINMSAITKENMSKNKLEVVAKSGEATILAEFKPKKNNLSIKFRDEPEVLPYLDIKGYSLNGPYLVVQEHDDTQYIYPMDTVEYLKLYVTE